MTIKAQTLSVVVGTDDCNAHCPFCIGRINHSTGVVESINWRNFERSLMLCDKAEIETALLTGKGEPTLFPAQISAYLNILNRRIPFNELQTNGILLPSLISDGTVKGWYDSGLTTVCISAVHVKRSANSKIYSKNYPKMTRLISKLHDIGLSVRLSFICIKDYLDSSEAVEEAINYARVNEVEQTTFRPVTFPFPNKRSKIYELTTPLDVIADTIIKRYTSLDNKAAHLRDLVHGGVIYDIDGQNVCFSNCMTIEPSTKELRQIIFYPDGHLRYDWRYKGAILL